MSHSQVGMRVVGSQKSKASGKASGMVFTPESIASFLSDWAIRSPEDVVIDPGAGEGIFTISAYRRLLELGQRPEEAVSQVYGVERDPQAYEKLEESLTEKTGWRFPFIFNADLFETEFPLADAVVGNPPYVKRHLIKDIEKIRAKFKDDVLFRRQTDLYCYFVAYASRFLKPDGRLAVIVSDSWLKMNYGVEFKRFLLDNFHIEALISFSNRVFENILVKSVLILGEKQGKQPPSSNTVFARIEDPSVLSLSSLDRWIGGAQAGLRNYALVTSSELSPRDHWDSWLKAPEAISIIHNSSLLCDLRAVAQSRIGLQTLAKDFYILDSDRARRRGIEREFLEPLAFSPREHKYPLISSKREVRHFLFYCDRARDELENTQALEHITNAERATVTVRHREEPVVGYQNLPRLRKAGRKPWYNIKSEVERRGRYPILIPRRTYKSFLCVWNKARVVPNENFIEVAPLDEQDVVPLLAFLNSSLGELCVRLTGHVYGGGVSDLNPRYVRRIRVPDIRKLKDDDTRRMRESYRLFCRFQEREILDDVIYDVVGFSAAERETVEESLETVTALSTAR